MVRIMGLSCLVFQSAVIYPQMRLGSKLIDEGRYLSERPRNVSF